MPSVSQKQHNFFAAAAHNADFAKRAKIRQSVAREFMQADKSINVKKLPLEQRLYKK